jgi:phytoene desaturase
MPINSQSQSPRSAVVIGSGFGGLSAAIRLQAMGMQTTLIEQHDKPGGRAGIWEQDGFRFDAGPTVVTAPHCLEELFNITGKSMQQYIRLKPVDPMYRLFWEDGTSFDYTRDEKQLLRNIETLSPDDVEGYSRFQKYASKVFEKGYLDLGHVPFLKITDMLAVAPDLIRLNAHRSVYSIVSDFIKNPKLRQAFSFNSLLIGGNPFVASAIYTLIHPLEKKWGAWFPEGGMHALVTALTKLFEDCGGQVRMSTTVTSIDTKNGQIAGVTTADGHSLRADIVVSNADIAHTYTKLLKNEPRLAAKRRSIVRKRYSPSLFLVYFGTNKSFPGLLQHNVMFGPRYKEHLADIFDNGVLADDFSLYLHAPSVTDGTLAPAGCQTFYALSPVPNNIKSGIDWKDAAPAYRERIINYLEQRYMPGLSASIVTEKVFTPDDFATRLQAFGGSAFSLEPVLTQSAWFRIHNRDRQVRGLYFCGAGTHPGAGIPGVVASGKATADVIAKDYGFEAFHARSAQMAAELKYAALSQS